MRHVVARNEFRNLLLALFAMLVAPGCLGSAGITWTAIGGSTSSSYHLAFVNYTQPATFPLSTTPAPVQVAVQNSLTQSSPTVYTVSLGTYLDARCSSPVTLSGSISNLVGTPTATVSGVATISLNGGNGQPTAGIPYYFQASAPGLAPVCSSSLTFTSGGSMSLMVPIEMLDLPAYVTASTTTITRSQTTLNTADYDGSPIYYFDLVATMSGASGPLTISLLNGVGASVATAPVYNGAGTVHSRMAFTPTTGLDTYKISLAAGTGNLTAYAARILVQQTGATRTKIYIPLLGGGYSLPSLDTIATRFVSGASSSYVTPTDNNSSIWQYTGQYADLISNNPWTLETVMSATSGTAFAALYDLSVPQAVMATEVSTSAATATIVQQSFPNSALTLGHSYELDLRNDGSSMANIYRAGLWVSLTNLNKAEIYNRFMMSVTGMSSSGTYIYERMQLDPSKFSNPIFYIESTGSASGGSSTVDVAECPDDVNASCSSLGMVLTFNSSTTTLMRSSTPLPGSTGNRYVFNGIVSTGTLNIASSFVVVKISH
jgi:hypothetical protein